DRLGDDFVRLRRPADGTGRTARYPREVLGQAGPGRSREILAQVQCPQHRRPRKRYLRQHRGAIVQTTSVAASTAIITLVSGAKRPPVALRCVHGYLFSWASFSRAGVAAGVCWEAKGRQKEPSMRTIAWTLGFVIAAILIFSGFTKSC